MKKHASVPNHLKRVLELIGTLYRYQTVTRAYTTPYGQRLENDVEHSYILAMLAWYLIEREKLPLRIDRVLKYCLAHDLVEVYTGDTWTVGTAEKKHRVATKEIREKRAQKRLQKKLSLFKDMHVYIDGYKKKKDPESQFVYALDKIIPNLSTTLQQDKGKRTYHKIRVTHAMLEAHKRDKVSLHPTTAALWKSLSSLLAHYDTKHGIFPRTKNTLKKKKIH